LTYKVYKCSLKQTSTPEITTHEISVEAEKLKKSSDAGPLRMRPVI
jgi:hypothetical protein